MLLWALQHEIGSGLARPRQRGPQPVIVWRKRIVRQLRPVRADALIEGGRPRGRDVVVLLLDPFHVRPETHAAGEIERHVHAEPTRHGDGVDEPRRYRSPEEAEVISFGENAPGAGVGGR